MSNFTGLKTGRPSGRTAEHVKGMMSNYEEEKRLNVIMPAGEYQHLKLFAAATNRTISQVIRAAIKQTMATQSQFAHIHHRNITADTPKV